ncbi:MAG: hypothetical protein ACRDH7_07525 [Actinomycetota bacterium]
MTELILLAETSKRMAELCKLSLFETLKILVESGVCTNDEAAEVLAENSVAEW